MGIVSLGRGSVDGDGGCRKMCRLWEIKKERNERGSRWESFRFSQAKVIGMLACGLCMVD